MQIQHFKTAKTMTSVTLHALFNYVINKLGDDNAFNETIYTIGDCTAFAGGGRSSIFSISICQHTVGRCVDDFIYGKKF